MSYRVICTIGASTASGSGDEEGFGWFGRFRKRIAKEYPYKFGFVNLAVSGDRSTNMLYRLQNEVLSRQPDILIIMLGSNDLIRWHTPEEQTAFSKEMSTEAISYMLKQAKKSIQNVLVVGTRSVDESQMPIKKSSGQVFYYLNKDIIEYNKLLRDICKEYNVPFYDSNEDWIKYPIKEILYDQVHPNAKGHQIICDQIYQQFKNLGWLEEGDK